MQRKREREREREKEKDRKQFVVYNYINKMRN